MTGSLLGCGGPATTPTADAGSDAVLEACTTTTIDDLPEVEAKEPMMAAEMAFPNASFVDAGDPDPATRTYDVSDPSGCLTICRRSDGTWHPAEFVYC